MKLAPQLHSRLGTDLTQAVDIYDAIRQLDVTLAFAPLKALSGAYLPAMAETGELPGIIVNSRHPRSRQRYSAAHELGHHLRDGQISFDAATELLQRTESVVTDQREAVAESFAAWFLMPRGLVAHKLDELGIAQAPSPEDTYRLSLALGTSYLAAAAHLYTLKHITRARFRDLAAVPPKWIKSQVAVHGPEDSWGDVWLVREQEGGHPRLNPRPGDEIVIELAENPSTGYRWELEQEPNGVEVLESSFEAPAERAYGAGSRRVVLRADLPGAAELRLIKTRSWDRRSEPTKVFTVSLSIERAQETLLPALV